MADRLPDPSQRLAIGIVSDGLATVCPAVVGPAVVDKPPPVAEASDFSPLVTDGGMIAAVVDVEAGAAGHTDSRGVPLGGGPSALVAPVQPASISDSAIAIGIKAARRADPQVLAHHMTVSLTGSVVARQ